MKRVKKLRIFSIVLFWLSAITGALTFLAIVIDLLLFDREMFVLSEYIQSFLLIIFAVFFWYIVIPYYQWMEEMKRMKRESPKK